jgi:hypothetical protein
MCISIYVQDEFVDPHSSRVFEDIGRLRSCKSLASNWWGAFEPGPTKDKLGFW